jgi:hypothetical protein
LRHSGWPGHVLRQNSGRSARAIRADRQSLEPPLPISARHSGWPGHVRRQNIGRSALAIRAVRQSLGGLPLVSVRHSGWPGHVLRQNSGRSARAIRAIRQLVSCAKLFELPTVIIPSEAALPKIKTAVIMRAGTIRILSIRALLTGQADTIIRSTLPCLRASFGLQSLCSIECLRGAEPDGPSHCVLRFSCSHACRPLARPVPRTVVLP